MLPFPPGEGKQDTLTLTAKPWAEGTSCQQHCSPLPLPKTQKDKVRLAFHATYILTPEPCWRQTSAPLQQASQYSYVLAVRGRRRVATEAAAVGLAQVPTTATPHLALGTPGAPHCLLKQRFLFPSGCSETVVACFVTLPSEIRAVAGRQPLCAFKEGKTTKEAYRERQRAEGNRRESTEEGTCSGGPQARTGVEQQGSPRKEGNGRERKDMKGKWSKQASWKSTLKRPLTKMKRRVTEQ